MTEAETYVWKCPHCGRCKDRKIGDNPSICGRCAEGMWDDDRIVPQSKLAAAITMTLIVLGVAGLVYAVIAGGWFG